MATLDTVDLQAAVDTLTTDRVVDILQKTNTQETGYDAWYCTVRTTWNNLSTDSPQYGISSGKACWVQTTEANNAATQAAEILAGLGAVAVRNGPLDPDVFQDNA